MDNTLLEQEIAKFKSINEDRLTKISLLKKQYKEDKWLITQMEASLKRRKEDADNEPIKE